MPYLFLSKKSGDSISSLNIHFPVRYPIKVIDLFTDSSGKNWFTSDNFAIPYRIHGGQDFVIADVSSDTIYRLTNSVKLFAKIHFLRKITKLFSANYAKNMRFIFRKDKNRFLFAITVFSVITSFVRLSIVSLAPNVPAA